VLQLAKHRHRAIERRCSPHDRRTRNGARGTRHAVGLSGPQNDSAARRPGVRLPLDG
jgi:hypothetical protein